jgi:hypothetical protein
MTPKVKSLEWESSFAHTPFGLFYQIRPTRRPEPTGFLLLRHEGSSTVKSFHDTDARAREVAQADFDSRILSALEPTTDAGEVPEAEAQAAFTEYFARNYPGPDTIIGNPHWHAPKIFRAALYALKHPVPTPTTEPTEDAPLGDK